MKEDFTCSKLRQVKTVWSKANFTPPLLLLPKDCHFPPRVLYLVSHCECQWCTSNSRAIGYRSQHKAGLSQELTGQGLQDRGCWLHGFGGRAWGGLVGRWLGVELRSNHGESLRHGGYCTIEHFLPRFFHLSLTCWHDKNRHVIHVPQPDWYI